MGRYLDWDFETSMGELRSGLLKRPRGELRRELFGPAASSRSFIFRAMYIVSRMEWLTRKNIYGVDNDGLRRYYILISYPNYKISTFSA